MNKERPYTLLIMAAGMGSRFGGLKQIEPMGPNGEFLLDYSIYDAIQAGFQKVVFVIKEENYELFQETVGKRIEKQIQVEYAFQKITDIPTRYQLPKDRVKPLGTAQAILAAKDKIQEDFAVINADDFYGRDAFFVLRDFFLQDRNSSIEEYAIVGYQIQNTLTENGAVKRGVCQVKDEYLERIIESSVEKKDGVIVAEPLDGSSKFEVEPNRAVSMNMFAFTPAIFTYIEDHFPDFFEKNKADLSKCEYLIPDVVTECIQHKIATVKVLPTTAKWQGITYLEDKEKVVKAIAELIAQGEYPQKLWK